MPKLGEKSDSGAQTSDARNYAGSLRVLAVDDNIVCLTFLSRLLKKCNYQFTATKKANEACQILMNNRDSYDIVLTNVKANKDGFRLAEMIIKVQLDIPVVFVSANDDVKLVRECVRMGVDYLPKPVHLADVKLIWKHAARREHLQKSSSKKETINSGLIRSLTWDTQSIREIEAEIKTQVTEENKKKQRFKWGTKLHDKFVTAINKLGFEKAVPKRILEIMDEPTLSRENVSSHLQKYRRNLDKEKERAKNKYQDVEKAVNYLQFSDTRKQIRSSIVNGPIIHPSPSTWPEHELESMRMKITYSRPQENENNYFESIACFSDGHNSNGGSVSMPPSINSLPMLSQSSSYDQLHGSTQLTGMSHPVNFQTLPHSSNPYGPIYVQGRKQSGPMAETANSIIMVPPSSPCGPIHIRDSSHPSPTSGQLERRNSLDTFPDYFEDYLNSDCENDEDLRAMWKVHSALTLDHPN